jgi:predicted nucleotidyltransferase component of viral defense system
LALTSFQIEVARLFFELPASAGFVLAGGAALAAQRLITRPTQDLDLSAGLDHGNVTAARDAFEAAARDRGWRVHRVRVSASFCRLMVSGPEDLIVDLALDAPPNLPPIASVAGPTFALEELAGRKLIALFDRAEARDFVDVYTLAHRFSKQTMLTQAAQIDSGFDRLVLAEMARMHARFADHDFPAEVHQVLDIRAFFDEWADELEAVT